MSSKALAEFIGTFILVFFGVGSAVLMGAHIGFHGIAVAFGLSIIAAAYGFGAISGAQLNPAVSFGFLASGRMGWAISSPIASRRFWVPSPPRRWF